MTRRRWNSHALTSAAPVPDTAPLATATGSAHVVGWRPPRHASERLGSAERTSADAPGWGSFLQGFVDELELRLRAGIVGQTDVCVELVMRGLPGAVDLHRDARILQHADEPLRLRAGVGVSGDVHDQERGDALVPGHVRHGGEVAVLRRVVAELLAVAE